MPRRRPLARTAGYDPTTGRYTNQRPVSDPWLNELAKLGRSFWASRGVNLPENTGLYVSDDLGGPDTEGLPGKVIGRGRTQQSDPNGEAWVAMDADFVAGHLRRARNRKQATSVRRSALKELAAKMLHEQGHVGGVEHTEGDEAGMMGAFGAGDIVPQEIASEVRRLIKRRQGERPGKYRNYGIG